MPRLTEVVVYVRDMAKIMSDSDLAIGAVGTTAWERCCLGLPSIRVVLARNQRQIAKSLAIARAALELPFDQIEESLQRIFSSEKFNENSLLKIINASKKLIVGMGIKVITDNILFMLN